MDEAEAFLENGRVYLRLGTENDQILTCVLLARLGKGRNLYLQGEEDMVQFLLGTAYFYGGGVLSLTMPIEILEELCSVLASHIGTYLLYQNC